MTDNTTQYYYSNALTHGRQEDSHSWGHGLVSINYGTLPHMQLQWGHCPVGPTWFVDRSSRLSNRLKHREKTWEYYHNTRKCRRRNSLHRAPKWRDTHTPVNNTYTSKWKLYKHLSWFYNRLHTINGESTTTEPLVSQTRGTVLVDTSCMQQ